MGTLVFNRRKGQTVCIGEEIEVFVIETHRSSVRLGVRAPAALKVLRAELVDREPKKPQGGGTPSSSSST